MATSGKQDRGHRDRTVLPGAHLCRFTPIASKAAKAKARKTKAADDEGAEGEGEDQ